MLLLVLVVLGEFLSAPSIVLADGGVLNYLGDEAGARYGHQRMFGSLGWALSMFFIGIALDHSTFPNKKCSPLVQVVRTLFFFEWASVRISYLSK